MRVVSRLMDVLIEGDEHDKLKLGSTSIYLLAQRWELRAVEATKLVLNVMGSM